MAEERLVTPSTTIIGVPIAGVADITNLTVAEINAGVNFSCAIAEGYALNPTDSDTDDTRTICDDGNVDNMTDENYEGNFTFFIDNNAANASSVFNLATSFFADPVNWIAVKRVANTPASAPIAAGDIVSWFAFESDHPKITDEKGTPKQMVVPQIPSGTMILRKTLT